MAGGQPGRGNGLAIAAIQPRMTQAQPRGEGIVPSDSVARRQLDRTLIAIGHNKGGRWTLRNHGGAVYVARAREIEGLRLEPMAQLAGHDAQRQVVCDPAGRELALEIERGGILPAFLVLAAEVVVVERAVGAEPVEIAFRAAAERKRCVVVI